MTTHIGRPKMPKSVKKFPWAIRLNKEEMDILRRAADSCGVTVAEFIRASSLKAAARVREV